MNLRRTERKHIRAKAGRPKGCNAPVVVIDGDRAPSYELGDAITRRVSVGYNWVVAARAEAASKTQLAQQPKGQNNGN